MPVDVRDPLLREMLACRLRGVDKSEVVLYPFPISLTG